jgi:hypothetical protein
MNPLPATQQEHAQAGELFERALEAAPGERERAVREATGYSERVRAEALALLAQTPADAFLHPPAETSGAIEHVMRGMMGDDPGRLIGARVGVFIVEALLGVGGMGTVYRATDSRSGQGVALKVLRSHAMSKAAVARLEREARVLSRMQHPCIARVLSAGVSGGAEGRAYFAMELLEGALPVTQWARSRQPDLRTVLGLFVRVCDAVHHGHQRGVIHRDLKPANILVLPDGTPKLIDFGVAFASDSDISRVTVSTGAGALVGTFAYMSPEQCEGDVAAIDTRSDVYALGVVLFELIAGERPHDLQGRTFAEVIRIIRRGESRRIESLRPGLPGDVATIIRKAMDPDPERRYVSAADLSQDVSRYLNALPIEARPAGPLYHMKLMWRRHRLAVGAAGIAAAFVVSAGVVSLMFGLQAKAEENRSKTALLQEAEARGRAERMTNFLRGAIGSANPYQPRAVNKVLLDSAADPWAEWMSSPWSFAGADGRKATVEDVLSAAAQRLPLEFGDDPHAEADLSETLGVTLFRLERLEEARVLLSRCVDLRLASRGERDEATIRAMMRLAAVYDVLRLETARVWHQRAYDNCLALYGALDPRTLRAQQMVAFAAYASGEDGVSMVLKTVPLPDDPGVKLAPPHLLHIAFATLLQSHRAVPEGKSLAEAVLRRVEAGEADSDPLARMLARRAAVGALLNCGGDIESLRPHAKALEQEAAELYGAWSPDYMNTMGSLMGSGIHRRATDESAVYYARAAAAQLRMRGQHHWETGNALNMSRYTIGRVAAISPTAGTTADSVILALAEFPQGATTPSVVAECLLARVDLGEGQGEAAMARLEAIERRIRAPQAPRLHPHAWARLHTVRGECLRALGRMPEARAAFEEAVATSPQFQHADDAEEWTREARQGLEAP